MASPPPSEPTMVLAGLARSLAPYRGDKFLAACVLALTRALGVRIAFVAENREPQAHALAFADRDNMRQPFFYDHHRAPCRAVLAGQVISVPCNVAELYPGEKGMQAYLGVPMFDAQAKVIGLLAIMDDRAFVDESPLRAVLTAWAPRVAAELECVQLLRGRSATG